MKKIFLVLFSFILLPIQKVCAQSYTTSSLKEEAAAKLNPSNVQGVSDLMSRGINAMVMFMGTIALALMVYAGFLWMTAAGNDSKIEKARTILVWTAFGAVAIGASYGFVRFVINIFG
ncbi:MAG TPA: hypothetical protein P5230_02560 [Candidatus Magasanikbacteria bacterium]|nr:hypothetical protein [Candidatus Magasanikbacteria bacterium]